MYIVRMILAVLLTPYDLLTGRKDYYPKAKHFHRLSAVLQNTYCNSDRCCLLLADGSSRFEIEWDEDNDKYGSITDLLTGECHYYVRKPDEALCSLSKCPIEDRLCDLLDKAWSVSATSSHCTSR